MVGLCLSAANSLELIIFSQGLRKQASWQYSTPWHALPWPSTPEIVHVTERKSVRPRAKVRFSLSSTSHRWMKEYWLCLFSMNWRWKKTDDYQNKLRKKEHWTLSTIKCSYPLEIKNKNHCTLLRIKSSHWIF